MKDLVIKYNMCSKRQHLNNIPYPFNFYSMIIGGDHLHFGLWPEDSQDLSLEEAQEVMFKNLLALFPETPARVLDVGCGLGFSAKLLASKGYEVCAIAPSESLIEYAKHEHGINDVQFLLADFMDHSFGWNEPESFDVIFFQESLQYLHPLKEAITKAGHLLRKNGIIVAGDEVCLDPDIKTMTSVHMLEDIFINLCENSFKIKLMNRVGKQVRQTCSIVINRLQENYDNLLAKAKGFDPEQGLNNLISGWKNQKRWYETEQFDYLVFVAQKDDIEIGRYHDGEGSEILEMFNKIFNVRRTMDHWQWKFKNSPFGNKNIAVARGKDGSMAAHFCAYPVPFYCGDVDEKKIFLTAQAGDTMTNPAYRNVGLGKSSVLARLAFYFYYKFCENNYPFIYGFNTGKIKKLGERYLDYEYINAIPYHCLKLDDPQNKKKYRPKKFQWVSICKESSLGNEYEKFFNEVCNDYQMLVKRDYNYLKWRYFDCPDKKYHFYAVRRFGKLLGWAVFCRKEKKLIWGDSLFKKKYKGYLKNLLSFVIHNSFQDIKSIEGWFSANPQWWTMHLKDMGFITKQEPSNLFPCFKIFDKSFNSKMFESSLYYTMGDSDLF